MRLLKRNADLIREIWSMLCSGTGHKVETGRKPIKFWLVTLMSGGAGVAGLIVVVSLVESGHWY